METVQALMIVGGIWNLFLTGRALKRGSWKFGTNVYSRSDVPAGFWFYTACGLCSGVFLLTLPLLVI